MTLEQFLNERSKVSINKILEYFRESQIEKVKSKIEYIGKKNNIIKFIYPVNSILQLNKKLQNIKLSQKEDYCNFINKLHLIISSFDFEEIDSTPLTCEFFNYQLLNIGLQHPDRNQTNTFLTKKFVKVPNSAKVYEIISNNNLSFTNCSFVNKNEEIYSPLSLRTHTTASVFEFIYKNDIPKKGYIIGDIFRREREDALHLIQFTQLQLFISENISYESFLSLIRSILLKIGILNCKFTPTKYPYTQPSFQLDILYHDKWVELGGGGIFFKNITQAFTENICYGFAFGCQRLYLLLNNLNTLQDLDEI